VWKNYYLFMQMVIWFCGNIFPFGCQIPSIPGADHYSGMERIVPKIYKYANGVTVAVSCQNIGG
jgi:hypothetical protein